jgi:hypothetical protein
LLQNLLRITHFLQTGKIEWPLGDMCVVMATTLQPVMAPLYALGTSAVFSRHLTIHDGLNVYAVC